MLLGAGRLSGRSCMYGVVEWVTQERSLILADHRHDILEYCLEALRNVDSDCAAHCREAMDCLADGRYRAAQSHAAGITEAISVTFTVKSPGHRPRREPNRM